MKLEAAATNLLQPDPLDPADIVSGTPEAFSLDLTSDETTGESCGLWSITPGVVTDTEVEEKSLIMAGKAKVEFEDGRVVDLFPGVVLEFAGGEKTTWTVEETIFKSYWIRD